MLRFPSLYLTVLFLARATSAQPGGMELEPANNTLIDVIAANGNLTKLTTVMKNAPGFTERLGASEIEATLFALSDEAFGSFDFFTLLTPQWEAHMEDVLLFHITAGSVSLTDLVDGMQLRMLNQEVVSVNIGNGAVVLTSVNTEGSMVIQADIGATNGVVHVVDSILIPAWNSRTLFSLAGSDNSPGSEKFTIWGELLVLSGLADLYFAPGIFLATILAPTDAAFEALGEDMLAFYRNPNNTMALTSLLNNHVVRTPLPSSRLIDALVITTVSELELVVSISTVNEVMLNNATVVEANILAKDGIVHVVDTVIMMPTEMPNTTIPTAASPSLSPVSIAPASQAPTDGLTQRNVTSSPSNAPLVASITALPPGASPATLVPATAPPFRVPTVSPITVAPNTLSTTSQPTTRTASQRTTSPPTIAPMVSSPVPTNMVMVARASRAPAAVPTGAITSATGTPVGSLIGIIAGCLVAGGTATACFLKWQQRRNTPDSVIATSAIGGEVSPVDPPEESQDNARKVYPGYKDQVQGPEGGPAPLAQAVPLHDGIVDAENSSILFQSSFPSQSARLVNN